MTPSPGEPSDRRPLRPGGSAEEVDEDAQVSEVGEMDERGQDTPIAPGDSTAGYPDSETGGPDEGPTGPEAPTFDPDQDRYSDKDELPKRDEL